MDIKNKKVGAVVIMHKGQNNYGSSLQGFATVKMIESLGYDYEVIKYAKKDGRQQQLRNIVGLLRSGAIKQMKYLRKKKRDLAEHKEFCDTKQIRCNAVDRFKDKYLNSKSCTYNTFKELQAGSKKYDVVMVGSDQVWGPLSLYSQFYNLLFVDPKVPKFSYASSFGVSEVFSWQKKGVADFLSKLNLVGVREKRGKEIVKELTGKEAKVVLDPTFLLKKEEWEKNIDESRCKIDEPYILTYLLGERADIRETAKELKKKTGIRIVNLPHIDNYHDFDDNLGDINLYDVDPFDFIRLIRDAEYVLTDSFHGSVFSILMHKKFITFYRQNPSTKGSTHSRIDSLFSLLGLTERLYKNQDIQVAASKVIDYEYVDKVLENMREDSINFFKQGLELSQC